MKLIRSLQVFVMSFALLLAAGCQTKGPAPKEGSPSTGAAPVGTTETGGAHPGAAQDPHAGMGVTQTPHGAGAVSGQPDASGMIDVGDIAFKVPGEWQVQPPKSSMRRAQLAASGSAGPAELIVYFFGAQGAGTAEANVERWIGQFTNADGSPVSNAKKSSSKVAGFDVTKVEVAGQYASGMAAGQPETPQAGQRLIAAIVDTAGGPYYFKFLGPEATVTEQRAAFDDVIASIIAAP